MTHCCLYMSIPRRSLVATAALMAAAGFSAPVLAAADAWPATKPITLIVPFSAGGNVDTTARLIGQKLGERLHQSIVVDNVPGAGGVLGVSKAVKAPADGYTLLMGFDGPISIAQLVNSAVKYDAEKDLTPVGLTTIAPVVAVARPGLPAHNLNELIALARSKPGSLTYATSGVGTMLHLAMEMLQERAKIKLVHVPYRGGAQITSDVMGGQVDVGMLTTVSAVPMIQQKKLEGLGVTSAKRIDAIHNVPTFGETAELKGFVDAVGGADVEALYAVIGGAAAVGHLDAGEHADQLLGAAGRVAGGDGDGLDAGFAAGGFTAIAIGRIFVFTPAIAKHKTPFAIV